MSIWFWRIAADATISFYFKYRKYLIKTIRDMKNRVTGLGGFFFKTENPDQIKQWYKEHLGIPTDQYGWTFWWKDKDGNDCSTQWSPFKEDTYFRNSINSGF